jgi:hypothetical protein
MVPIQLEVADGGRGFDLPGPRRLALALDQGAVRRSRARRRRAADQDPWPVVRIFAGDESGRYYLSVSPIDEPGFGGRCFGLGWYGEAEYVGWWMYEFEGNLSPLDVGEFAMTLTPEGGSPIRGSIVVRGAD